MSHLAYSAVLRTSMLPRNHPILKEDGLLSAFLTEPSFDLWRKQASYSLDEESAFKRVDRIEEMTIPSDLEDKMAYATRYHSQP